MQVLTTTGYKNIEDCVIGEELVAYDINTGAPIVNQLEGKKWFSPDMFEDEYSTPEPVLDENGNQVYEQIPVMDENGYPVYGQVPVWDENGDPVLDGDGNQVYENGDQLFENGDPFMTTPELLKTKKQVFEETYGSLTFYTINDTYKIFANQSIWANLRVVHGSMIQVGDVIYDDQDEDIVIRSVEEGTASGWWRLTVSGDHSYIADNLTLHNASRYWVSGGASANWNATGNTNWGSSSGTQDNSSVPTSADDVTFDGAGTNGNDNSTISATITILSLNITTGYTATMTHNAVLTIAGNWTYVNTYTIAGTSGITISAASTITSNGVTWPNDLNFGTGTKTLSGNLTVSGLLTISAATTINKTTSETLTCSNGIRLTSYLNSGTAKIILTGGTWSASSGYEITNDLDINGNVTISGLVSFYNKTLTYISGTVTTTGSTLRIYGNCTLNTSGITWNKFQTANLATTITLTSNLVVNGLFENAGGGNCTVNKANSETVTLFGGIKTSAGHIYGTAKFILKGGTWSSGGAFDTGVDLDIEGDITVSGTVYFYKKILTYISGTVTTTGSTLVAYSTGCTLNTNGITWDKITFGAFEVSTITLTSNLTVNGLMTISNTTTLNRTNSETVTCGGGITVSNNLSGTAKLILTGGTWSGSTRVENNIDIQGNVTISGTVLYGTNTLTYVSGTVTTTSSTLSINASCTLNTSGITWNNLTFSATNTTTLTSNLTVNGLMTVSSSSTTTLNKTISETITVAGGLTTSSNLSGTAEIILTGGTWSTLIGSITLNNLTLNGNITLGSTINYGGIEANTLKYTSGTITTTGSIVNFTKSTIDLNGITFNNIDIRGGGNFTLKSNLTVGGSCTVGAGTTYINRTTAEEIICNNGLYTSGDGKGTITFRLKGGLLSGTGLHGIGGTELIFDGDIIISKTIYMSFSKYTYTSGTITPTIDSNWITFVACSFDMKGATIGSLEFSFNNGSFPILSDIFLIGNFVTGGNTTTITLSGNVFIGGTLLIRFPTIINTSTAKTITSSGGFTTNNIISGTADIYLTGGTWSGVVSAVVKNNLYLNGNVTLSGNIYYGIGTFTFLNGKIRNANATLNIDSSSTLLNFHKCPIKAVVITAGQTITMNRFFSGTPSQICQVSSTGANYTITFQDQFEKMARHVAISGCTLSRPMQLIVTTNPKFNTNRNTNVGIRYVNQSPNGIARNAPSINDTMTSPALGLASDPNFIMQ